MAYNKAYWITPDKEILDISVESHISFVTKYPELFDLTREEIETCYQKHAEKLWTEGKAREEIILQLLDKAFIRVRLYPRQYWSITANKWNGHTKTCLIKWAEQAKNFSSVGKYMNVRIAVLGKVICDYTVDDLFQARHSSQ